MKKVAVVGGGIIGTSWALVFARAGVQTVLYDHNPENLVRAQATIREQLANNTAVVSQSATAADILGHIRYIPVLDEAVDDADYVQEAVSEDLGLKQRLFAQIEQLVAPTAILASSTSTYGASLFTADLQHPERCLVVHPMTPPHLMPIVELVASQWTDSDLLQSVYQWMSTLGQAPVLIHKEVPGFVLNRLQGALLLEMFELIAQGVISPVDADQIIKKGLGLRWAAVGPLEGVDLNAPTGIKGYLERYGHIFNDMAQEKGLPAVVDATLIDRLDEALRAQLPLEALEEKRQWRDQAVVQLRRQLAQLNRDKLS